MGIFGIAVKAAGVANVTSWTWWLLQLSLPATVAGAVILAATYLGWFWQSFGMLGAIVLGVFVATLASVAFFLTGLAIQAWRAPSGDHPVGETTGGTGSVPLTEEATAERASIKLLGKSGSEIADELSRENVWRWYTINTHARHPTTGVITRIGSEIFICFDNPISPLYQKVTCSAKDVMLNVVDFNARFAIISTTDDLTDKVIEARFGSKPF